MCTKPEQKSMAWEEMGIETRRFQRFWLPWSDSSGPWRASHRHTTIEIAVGMMSVIMLDKWDEPEQKSIAWARLRVVPQRVVSLL